MPPTAPAAPADPIDADLPWLRQVAAGDRAAFRWLYRRHHPRLAGFLRRFTPRADLIDEVVNDTMWVVWRQANGFRGDSKVSTWITGIAHRTMLKALRSGAPRDEVGESMLDERQRGELAAAQRDDATGRDRVDWLASGMKTLPDEQRITLELAYGLGHSCEEIASIMDCAVGTVKARMFHARVRLRNVLPELGGGSASAGTVDRSGGGR